MILRLAAALLREIGATLDAMLGGDHRSSGHQPPIARGPEPTVPPPRPSDSARR